MIDLTRETVKRVAEAARENREAGNWVAPEPVPQPEPSDEKEVEGEAE